MVERSGGSRVVDVVTKKMGVLPTRSVFPRQAKIAVRDRKAPRDSARTVHGTAILAEGGRRLSVALSVDRANEGLAADGQTVGQTATFGLRVEMD